MKTVTNSLLRTATLAVSLTTGAALYAQAPAIAPAPAAPTTVAPTAAATPAPKPRPLSEADKRFFKEVSESILFEQKLVTVGVKANFGEDSKKALNTINGDLKRVWEKFATLSMEKNATIAADVSKADANKIERIAKQKEDKLEKELIDDLVKEAKKTSRLFESKTLQDPDVKKFADDWGPTIKGHEALLARAEKSVGKKR